MKTAAIVIILVIAFLMVCVVMAKKRKTEYEDPFALRDGLTYEITEDRYEKYPGRYELRVNLSMEPTAAEVQTITNRIRKKKDYDATYICLNRQGTCP